MTQEIQTTGGPGEQQHTLVTYAMLAGLTPLIPVPFVDDLAKDFFRRRLVETLAASRRLPLPPGTIRELTAERGGCALGGCLGQVLIYPLKKLLAKLFFFLEWKRVLDLTSQIYHFGYLVDCALQDGYLTGPRARPVEQVRQAIEAVTRAAPIRPVESAVAATFRQSRAALSAAVAELGRHFQGQSGKAACSHAEATLGAVEEQERRNLSGVAEALQRRLQSLPDAHFLRLREQLRQQLEPGRLE
jgi:hypothetical protein